MGRRAGRKRKEGRRHPNGQLVKTTVDLKTRTSRQPHRRVLKDEMRTDERAGSPLGRLLLGGVIDAQMYVAGEHFAYVVGQYLSVIDTPRATAGSGRGSACAVEREGVVDKMIKLFGVEKVITWSSCHEDPDNCECLKRKRRYDNAFEALIGVPLDAPGRRLVARYWLGGAEHSELKKAVVRAEASREGYLALPLQDQRAAKAVSRVAVHGNEPGEEEMIHLVRGLMKLKLHFGLTDARALTHSRNAN